MELRDILDQIILTTLEGRFQEALLLWSAHRECGPTVCTTRMTPGACSEACVLPRLLEMSLVYNRDNAYKAYQELKDFVRNEDNQSALKSQDAD